ncbi:MAG: DNA translocase FtsK, partial [Phototrophicaceae bacterium]
RYWKMQGLKQPELASTSALSSEFVVEKARPVQSSSSSSSGGGAFWDSSGGNGADDLPLFASANRSSNTSNDDSGEVELTNRELTGNVQEGNEDDLYDRAVELVRRLDKASISLLQRRLRIGYTRAARLIDVMEARGVVGPSKDGSSKPRDVIPE